MAALPCCGCRIAASAAGEPSEDAFVRYRSSAWSSGHWDFHGPAWAFSGARVGSDGSFRLEHVTPGSPRLRPDASGLECRHELQVSDGATARWDAVLVPAEICGRVLEQQGQPRSGVEVRDGASRRIAAWSEPVVLAGGRPIASPVALVVATEWCEEPIHVGKLAGDELLVRDVAPGRYRLCITSGSGRSVASHFVIRGADDDGRLIELRLP